METYWKPWPLPGYTLASLHYYCQESNAVSYCHDVKDNVDDYIWTAVYMTTSYGKVTRYVHKPHWNTLTMTSRDALVDADGLPSDWSSRFTM